MSVQLPLGIGLPDSATFDNYLAGPNLPAVHALQQGAEPYVYLWGGRGTGRTHLLQAACREAAAGAGTPAYLPLGELQAYTPEVLEDLEHLALICLDDVQAIAGRAEWERALFNLYNRVRDAGTRLLVAGASAPAALGVRLPDLVSRLAWGPVFHLSALSDAQKVQALQRRAAARGLELPDEVAAYLLKRCPRDMHSLFEVLDRLDQASLSAQRRLTVPFVRQLV